MEEEDGGHEGRWETGCCKTAFGGEAMQFCGKGRVKWGQKFAEYIRLICLNLF